MLGAHAAADVAGRTEPRCDPAHERARRRFLNAPATLFYDVDCGFCRWTAAKVAAWDRRGAVRLVALQDRAEADRLLRPLDEETRMASWHLVTADGGVHSAGRGLAPLLRLLPGGRLPARALSAAQPLTDAAYEFVAAHRSSLGRLVRPRGQARGGRR